ncbi:MAG: glycosyltransferase, partial [Verrucomicrobiae bacterium]|nr:glycosyltransferase [Verrucomicrobiae bacterium]
MRVLIACGGSGGHLFPGVAVAEALVSRGHEVRLLVSEKAADNAVLQTLGARAGWAVGISWVRATGYNGARGLWRFGTCLVGATWRCAR